MDDLFPAMSENLAAIHRAVLAGNYSALADLSQALENHLSHGGIGISEAAARQLRRQANDNAALLTAAQRGLRAAQRRMTEIRGVASGLTTYTAGGQRSTSIYRAGPDHRA